MKDLSIYYSVGALLYCPANHAEIAESVINMKFGSQYSLALCLEDTINDAFVKEAEQILINSLQSIYTASLEKEFFMPKIFIRVRSAEQMKKIYRLLGKTSNILCGYIIPKFSLENADEYINSIGELNAISEKTVYMMPIYESSDLIDLRYRYDILYSLKEKLAKVEKYVLNIRVGGNDLCHLYGFRRNVTETIYKIRPIANIFADIVTVYGMDYVISGPVWEYFNGRGWKEGLIKEIEEDKLCGFIGKTVIHPKQIEIANQAYKVSKQDYESAQHILAWDSNNASLVSADLQKERMDEWKTHTRWAQKILYLAKTFGVLN